MGRSTSTTGAKAAYYDLKSKTAVFSEYNPNGNEEFNDLTNVILTKIGRKQVKIKNKVGVEIVNWKYYFGFKDLDAENDPESKDPVNFFVVVPNYSNVLRKFLFSLLGLEKDGNEPVDISLRLNKAGYLACYMKKAGADSSVEENRVRPPFEWDDDKGFYAGVPNVIRTTKVVDGIEEKDTDDSELKAFMLDAMKKFCPKVLGNEFSEAKLGERLFVGTDTAATTSQSQEYASVNDTGAQGSNGTLDYVNRAVGYYENFKSLKNSWNSVVAGFAKEVSDEEEDMDFFFLKITEAAGIKYKLELVADADDIKISDLPF